MKPLFDIDNKAFFGYNLKTEKLLSLWGRNGFDGGFEVRGASSGGNRLKILTLKLNANKNLAYAA